MKLEQENGRENQWNKKADSLKIMNKICKPLARMTKNKKRRHLSQISEMKLGISL